MEAVAAALEGFALAEWLRYSRWGYATLSAVHILGIGLLVGAILPLDLRLLGFWSTIELRPLYRVLSRAAATGLVTAIVSGALLFATRASDYLVLELFGAKLALIGLGAAHAAVLHFAFDLPGLPPARRRLAGAVSLLIWPSVLLCGRFLAFV